MKFPLRSFPFSSVPSSVCLGKISVEGSNLNVNSKVFKKLRIIVVLTGFFKKTYMCSPPLLDLQGTTGKLWFLIIAAIFNK